MSNSPTVLVNNLRKSYQVPVREGGLKAALASLIKREMREVHAVADISFQVQPGEVVGFLGPNGAGKTTTLKMLSGLLFPTSGEAQVLGFTPSRRERAFLSQIALVMGNRNQLQWDLPALDSFELQRSVYRIPAAQFRQTRDELIDLLDLGSLVNKPVRNLSLGERMKMEFVGALLHRPLALFLDEPTIGLDITMQKRIRQFVAAYNHHHGATVLLTSHYMADVEALCKRVIIIHRGQLLFDGDLATLSNRFAAYKTIGVTLDEPDADLSAYGEVVGREDAKQLIRVAKQDVSSITAQMLARYNVSDLTIEDPPIDEVIEQAFAQGAEEPTNA